MKIKLTKNLGFSDRVIIEGITRQGDAMKTKTLKTFWTPKRFFLMMIVPLLLGLFIALSTPVLAQWESDADNRLMQTPPQQGWVQVDEKIKSIEE